jgi:hypothetical protein
VIGLMNNLLSIVAMFGGFVAFAVTLTLTGMLWSGKITLPGTDARRVQRADNDAQIAQFRFEAAQANLNREIMETRGAEEINTLLEAVVDGRFARQINERSET